GGVGADGGGAGGGAAGEGGGHRDLDVLGERLDLAPGAAAAVERAEVELGEVGHEDVGQVDEHALPAGVDAADGDGQQHRVGVGGLDGPGHWRAGAGLEADVAADQVQFRLADALEEQHPLLVEVQRVAAHAHAAGDGDGAQERAVELLRVDFGVERLVLLVEVEQAVK